MKNSITSFFIFLITSFCVSAQTTKLETGNRKYNELAYVDAVKSYEKLAKKGYKSVELFQNLGNSYYFNAKLKEANKWYAELFALNQPVDAEYYYKYSQTLKAVGEYGEANRYLDQFYAMSNSDIRGNIYENKKNYLEVISKNSGRYEVYTTDINSNVSDYGASLYGGQLIFSTSRDSVSYAKTKAKWTKQSFTNLYVAKCNEDGSLGKPERFSNTVNSKFHEATPVFTKDLKTVYFTRNNYNNGKTGYDENQVILLKLYKATLVAGKWENIQELPFNSDDYSVAHPALSPDGKTLYFASNMPGTKGQSDIFKVDILGEDSYGTPQNLEGINTEGRETFPYVTSDNELYFASDGQQGLGGLDIYAAKLSKEGVSGPIINVGSPVNGPMDDFAFVIDNISRRGYFSSNREGGKGFDDIYSFVEKTPLTFKCERKIAGTVYDKSTGAIIANSTIVMYDETGKELGKMQSDASGKYSFDSECAKTYVLKSTKEGYEPMELKVAVSESPDNKQYDLYLNKEVVKEALKEIVVGTDLAKTFHLEIIRFDVSKWNIRPDAAVQLDKIVAVMKEYPTLYVDVRSHTDSRDTNLNNMKLSDKRAKSTIAYIVSKGIDAVRLTGKGYGESQLLNKCADGVKCSQAEHLQNRRSEFIIVSM